MALFDLPLEQLRTYLPERNEPEDFDAFWERTLAEARDAAQDPVVEPVDYGIRRIESFDVRFSGYGGQPVKGWLQLPRDRTGPLPCVVEFLGYGGGRGFPTDWLLWSSVGYAHFVMDTRGQGSASLPGATPDHEPDGGNAQFPGMMTRGILDPATYYYRRVFGDAVRAVEYARNHPAVDRSRIAVAGMSQGGGIALAVSGLVPDLSAVVADVPFLCHVRRATEITDSQPYHELTRFCMVHRDKIDTVFRTLAYFDAMQFAARGRARALFSVALMDTVCPPSTVFAAYNHYAGPKAINVWRYNQHEGGGTHQVVEKVRFLNDVWLEPTAAPGTCSNDSPRDENPTSIAGISRHSG